MSPTHSSAPVMNRRTALIASALLAAPGVVLAAAAVKKPAARGKAMTAADESAAALAVAEAIADQTGESVHPAVGKSLRLASSFKLFNGQDFSEAQTSGKLLLIYYWASWCPVCKIVSPRLHKFWQQNAARGVQVLALSTDTEAQPAFAYIQQAGYKYPVSMAIAAKLGEHMAPRSLPTLMVRSKLGVIVSALEGEIEDDEFKDFLLHL
jgi:thiol-disulfide isomerase/thioredoxin